MAVKKMVALFDESGTPAIKDDERTDWFLGVGVGYEKSAEKTIFAECESASGLAKKEPLKNYYITNSRAVCVATILADLPAWISVSRVNTANPTYRKVVVDYEVFGNKIRQSRHFPRRRKAHIIHSHVLDHCLFHLITRPFEAGEGDAVFSVFMDNWSIPKKDIDIYLKKRTTSLRKSISSL